MMVLTLDGVPYTNFTRLSVTQSIEDFAGVFNFEATDVDGTFNSINYPVKIGSQCRVTIDDVPVLTGYVEAINISQTDNTHSVGISGRDLTCDLVDSSVSPSLNFSAQTISLEKLINDTQKRVGLQLPIINEVDDLTDFDAEAIYSFEAQGTIFDFLEPLARKKGVLLTTDGNGSIVITRGGIGGSIGKLTNMIFDGTSGNNNIIKSSITYDYSDRFQEYIAGSQFNLQALSESEAEVDNESITNSIASVIDDEMPRDTRKYYFISEETTETAELTTRINWEANLRKTRSQIYKATVEGHTIKAGVPYWFNKKATVTDDPMGVSESMLVQSVTFTESVADGELTTIQLVYRDAYTIVLETPESEADTNSLGAPFKLETPLTAADINETIDQQTSESASDVISQS